MKIIGRSHEKKQLEKIFQSNMAEFVALYGRRRVGKTYLIREFFKNKDCIFLRATGQLKGSLKKQLSNFKKELHNAFYKDKKGIKLSDFSDWNDAFEAITSAIELRSDKKKIVLFLDEVPWMATPKSGFLEALDYYWNQYWSSNKRIKLIICGSAASWIIKNVIHNTGGLHNRITLRMPIEPFSLAETKEYLEYRKIRYDNMQVLTVYMCLGGIPYYLNFIEKRFSAIQNINNACFSRKGTLFDEFDLLFKSLFKKHEIHEALISLIANKPEEISRTEIENKLKYKGGRLSERLKELEETGFIISFLPWGKEKGVYYKIYDEYTLFYLTWIGPRASHRITKNIDDSYWEVLSSKPAWKAWSGYAYESICFKHIRQIKKALSIPDGTEFYSWRYIDKDGKEDGFQIDLIFERPDNVINLCEIKYCQGYFVIDKQYAATLRHREDLYRKIVKTEKQIFHSIITTIGLKKNMYSEEMIASTAALSDLMK